jgi:curved DNA-binding protein CbpA
MAMPSASQSPAAGDPYAVLGVAPTATDAEIKQAYFAQVRAHPPESDPQAFKLVRAAYDRLRSPEKRLEADMLRLQAWPEPALPAELKMEPALDLSVAAEDVIRAARALTEMSRRDFREDSREIRW